MFLRIYLVEGRGIFGEDLNTGEAYIINTGRSFTGVTDSGKKCSVIYTPNIKSLNDVSERIIILEGVSEIENNVLISPDEEYRKRPV